MGFSTSTTSGLYVAKASVSCASRAVAIVSFRSVRNSLVNMDLSFANRNVDAMMHHADPEGDGQISWEEFKIVIAKYTTIPRIKVEKGDPDWHDAKSD
mmetsp:Transcript_6128/g.12159  ORF Transcript_6128/g.12159 Transcript_6128/m.12159 type:complete len:98 (+) Transcript_6128:1309-1602(+)